MMRMEERSEKVDPISWEDIAITIQMVIKPVRVDLASPCQEKFIMENKDLKNGGGYV